MNKPEAPRAPSAPATPRATPEVDRSHWTKPRMARFLRELAASHCVATAAKAVGMTRQSAYKLRARLKGEPFDIAWETAFQHCYDALAQAALERALHGVEVPHFRNGELVHVSRRYDERLTVFLLSARHAGGAQKLSRYAAASEYWSEARVEEGSAFWEFENPEPEERDKERARQAMDRQAPTKDDRTPNWN